MISTALGQSANLSGVIIDCFLDELTPEFQMITGAWPL
jgi:hypothetical protein